MPFGFDLSDLQIWTADGILISLGIFNDVPFFDEDPFVEEDTNKIYTSFSGNMEATFTGTILNPFSFNRMMKKLSYGWKAKGPVRKRVLNKLVKGY